ncbi:hypothetical protein [Ruminococcus sp. HUN007]|uniref:hypothetical protein n=1 Tax=Ruminococcus sp. HUN007 TaxID=1514668 RepID=UPI000679C940|nr:hypothetical protein [Ruminococcus sp. HUN007]
MKKCKSFIDYTIDDFKATPSIDDEERYIEGEVRKEQVIEWVNRFVQSSSLVELQMTAFIYKESDFYKEHKINIDFFIWQYIFFDINDKKRFNIIMQYIPTDFSVNFRLLHPICHLYDANEVLASYTYPYGTKQTRDKHKRELKKIC